MWQWKYSPQMPFSSNSWHPVHNLNLEQCFYELSIFSLASTSDGKSSSPVKAIALTTSLWRNGAKRERNWKAKGWENNPIKKLWDYIEVRENAFPVNIRQQQEVIFI